MASVAYGKGLVLLWEKDTDLEDDTIKCSLHTSTYSPDIDNDDFWDDCTNEVSGSGYTAGGATMANMAVSWDAANNRCKFDADDVTWSSATITNAYYAVIYRSTGTDSTSPVFFLIDFGANKSSSGGDFKITWHADGICYIG